MNTKTDRTSLALAACQGLSDAELAERGTQGYIKMRDRKRQYASMAKAAAHVCLKQQGELKKAMQLIADLQHQLKVAEAKIAMTESTDANVDDTADAASLLAKFTKPAA